MKRFLCLSVFVALTLSGNATFAADECAKITATGHPQYPVIAFKDGDNIVGAAPKLVEAIAKDLNNPARVEIHGVLGRCSSRDARRQGRHDFRHLL
jgi:polar amino acid transport system substrate-binding protein